MNFPAELILADAKKINAQIDFSVLAGKTLLITGASGLIGHYFLAGLKNHLLGGGQSMKVVAAVRSEVPEYFKEIFANDHWQIVYGDLAEQEFVAGLPTADYIIHAGGYGQPGKFLADPIKTFKINTQATAWLLEKLNAGGKFLFVSSSEIYSGSQRVPYQEVDSGRTTTDHPRACYIEGKRGGETLCQTYRSRGVDVKIARLSLAYGPGTKKNDQRVLNSFIQKALGGEINLLDAGAAKRTYCYVTDAVEMLWQILLFGREALYNVGGASKTTIAALAQQIGEILEVPVKFPASGQVISGAPDDVWLDLSRFKNEFGKEDFVGLTDGLARTIAWQRILYQSQSYPDQNNQIKNENKIMGRKFFVTGGLGYLGSAFAQEALKRGDSVLLYDSLIYEQDHNRIIEEIKKYGNGQGELKMVIGDTRNKELLRQSIVDFQPDYILHFGELSSVYACEHNPLFTRDINFRASVNVIDLAEELAIPILYNSSSSVYGNQPIQRLMVEDDPLPEPTDHYCRYKLMMEDYIKHRLAVNPDFKIIVFRPATVCGLAPRMRLELLPNHFTYCALANGLLRVSELNAYRAAIDVIDLIAGYFKVIDRGSWQHLLYNIGHHNLSKMQFATGIQAVVHCKIGPIADVGDLRNLQIDCSLFNDEFDFKPQISYEETIRRLAGWLDKNIVEIERTDFAGVINMSLERWKQLI